MPSTPNELVLGIVGRIVEKKPDAVSTKRTSEDMQNLVRCVVTAQPNRPFCTSSPVEYDDDNNITPDSYNEIADAAEKFIQRRFANRGFDRKSLQGFVDFITSKEVVSRASDLVSAFLHCDPILEQLGSDHVAALCNDRNLPLPQGLRQPLGAGDAKFAWIKADPKSHAVRDAIKGDGELPWQLIRDLGDRVVFYADDPDGPHKGEYVIFQLACFVTDSTGRVACFERKSTHKGRDRITWGQSVLVSLSSQDPPHTALGELVDTKLSFGRRFTISRFEPWGVAWNDLASKNGRQSPTYVMAIYELRLEPGNRLNGLIRDYPDTMIGWVEPADVSLTVKGYVDELVIKGLCEPAKRSLHGNEGRVVLSRECLVSEYARVAGDVEPRQIQPETTALILAATDDGIYCEKLFQALKRRGRGFIHPLHAGEDFAPAEAPRHAERLVERADCVVLWLTQHALDSQAITRDVERALELGVPIIPIWSGQMDWPVSLEYCSRDFIVGPSSSAIDDIAGRLVDAIQRVSYRPPPPA